MNNIPDELIARYLAGECNDDEKRQVQEWAKQHPDIMEEYVSLWKQIPTEQFLPDVEHALRNVNQRIDAKKKNRLGYVIGIISAAAAVLLLIVQIFGISFESTGEGKLNQSLLTLETGINETKEYILPDGSTVWLNQSSLVSYPETFTGDSREIVMEGEVFFDVAPNPDKPFIIHANNTITRVVGTSFGIRAIKNIDEVVVTVATGIVNVSTDNKAKNIELKQGEQGICQPKEQILERNANPNPNSLAWKTKILIFKNTPLIEVASVIENTYHTSIKVNASIADLQLTSTFEKQSLEDILQIIEMTLQIQTEKESNSITFTSAMN